jgi:hypothetical protein
MSATFRVVTPGSRPERINAAYLRLRRIGFGDPEAANLTALASGFRITSQAWTVRELAHLLFVRELYRVCLHWSGADDRYGTRVPPPIDRAPAPPVVDTAPTRPVQSRRPEDADPSGGAVTLLTLFRSMAGPNATLDQLRRFSPPGSNGEGG